MAPHCIQKKVQLAKSARLGQSVSWRLSNPFYQVGSLLRPHGPSYCPPNTLGAPQPPHLCSCCYISWHFFLSSPCFYPLSSSSPPWPEQVLPLLKSLLGSHSPGFEACYVTSGDLLNLSDSQFPHLYNGGTHTWRRACTLLSRDTQKRPEGLESSKSLELPHSWSLPIPSQWNLDNETPFSWCISVSLCSQYLNDKM